MYTNLLQSVFCVTLLFQSCFPLLYNIYYTLFCIATTECMTLGNDCAQRKEVYLVNNSGGLTVLAVQWQVADCVTTQQEGKKRSMLCMEPALKKTVLSYKM